MFWQYVDGATCWSAGGQSKTFVNLDHGTGTCKKTIDIFHILPRAGNVKLISISKLDRFFYNSMALLKDFYPSPACPSDKTSIKMKLSMEHWWNDTGNGKSKNVKRNVT